MLVVAVVEQDVQEEAQEQVEQAVVVLGQKLQAQRQQELQTRAVAVAVVEHAVLVVDQVVLAVKE